jgi:hypothetical protein
MRNLYQYNDNSFHRLNEYLDKHDRLTARDNDDLLLAYLKCIERLANDNNVICVV